MMSIKFGHLQSDIVVLLTYFLSFREFMCRNGDYALALETLLKIEKTITDKEDPRFLHNMR